MAKVSPGERIYRRHGDARVKYACIYHAAEMKVLQAVACLNGPGEHYRALTVTVTTVPRQRRH